MVTALGGLWTTDTYNLIPPVGSLMFDGFQKHEDSLPDHISLESFLPPFPMHVGDRDTAHNCNVESQHGGLHPPQRSQR